MSESLVLRTDDATGRIASVQLFGHELLDPAAPCASELWVNGRPLTMRKHTDPNDPTRKIEHLKGEHWVDHFSGWALTLARTAGERKGLPHRCVGVTTLVRREACDQTLPCPGPGGPAVEAPLYVDTLSILNWNWRFWGEETRMIFPSLHSSGPTDEFGHAGHEHDTPENAKKFLQNVWRRIYPGCMGVHGGVFYNARTGHWIAITCRRPQVGYILNIADAGRGVGYDFTLHAPLGLGEAVNLPEVKLYFGADHAGMMKFIADYITFYYEEPPAWVAKTLFGHGLAWDNQPTWKQQAEHWEKQLDDGLFSGIGYCLVTNRPIKSGTTPLGYEPDPNHGTKAEFKAMCHRLADRGVPVLTWMSHSGLCYRGGAEIDDDWFIRGIDGKICAAWGSIDHPEIAHINPGHPGYIEYTKKWIRFYIKECRCKGIFLDCLSWAFPPDFVKRPFMRYPGDTNRLAVKFVQEIYDCIKECDPEAILLGEGTSSDFPVNIYSIHSNPVRGIDGLGPRDFMLSLNAWAEKKLVIDQGPSLFPASGMCKQPVGEQWNAHSRYLTTLLRETGQQRFTPLPGDLSLRGDLLVVPVTHKAEPRSVRLPAAHAGARALREVITGERIAAQPGGQFAGVKPGIYKIEA